MKDVDKIASVLSFVVAHTNNEISEKQAKLKESLLEDVSARLNVLKENIETESKQAQEFLAQHVAFKSDLSSSLSEAIDFATQAVNTSSSACVALIEQAQDRFSTQISCARDASKADVKKIEEALESSAMTFTSNIAQLYEDIKEKTTALNGADEKLEESISKIDLALAACITNTKLDSKILFDKLAESQKLTQDSIATEVENLNHNIELCKRSLKEAVELVDETTAASITKIFDKIEIVETTTQSKIQESIKNISEQTETLRRTSESALTDLISSLSNKITSEIDKVNHVLSLTHKDVESLHNKTKQHDETLNSIKQDYVPKILLDAVEVEVKQYANDLVSKIPAPLKGDKGDKGDEGRPGLNWEFKFNPDSRGILMYRREDWNYWRHQNLVPDFAYQNDTNPLHYQSHMVMAGGGVGNGAEISKTFTPVELGGRSFNTKYKLSATQDGWVGYSIMFIPQIFDKSPGQTGSAMLQISLDGVSWTTISTRQMSLTGVVLFGTSLQVSATAPVTGYIPAGNFFRIQLSGTLVPVLLDGQEVLT